MLNIENAYRHRLIADVNALVEEVIKEESWKCGIDIKLELLARIGEDGFINDFDSYLPIREMTYIKTSMPAPTDTLPYSGIFAYRFMLEIALRGVFDIRRHVHHQSYGNMSRAIPIDTWVTGICLVRLAFCILVHC